VQVRVSRVSLRVFFVHPFFQKIVRNNNAQCIAATTGKQSLALFLQRWTDTTLMLFLLVFQRNLRPRAAISES